MPAIKKPQAYFSEQVCQSVRLIVCKWLAMYMTRLQQLQMNADET